MRSPSSWGNIILAAPLASTLHDIHPLSLFVSAGAQLTRLLLIYA